jgi:hypothetical protein
MECNKFMEQARLKNEEMAATILTWDVLTLYSPIFNIWADV